MNSKSPQTPASTPETPAPAPETPAPALLSTYTQALADLRRACVTFVDEAGIGSMKISCNQDLNGRLDIDIETHVGTYHDSRLRKPHITN